MKDWEEPICWNLPRGRDFTAESYNSRYTLYTADDDPPKPGHEVFIYWRDERIGKINWDDLSAIKQALENPVGNFNSYTMFLYDKETRVFLNTIDLTYLIGENDGRNQVERKISQDPAYYMGYNDGYNSVFNPILRD